MLNLFPTSHHSPQSPLQLGHQLALPCSHRVHPDLPSVKQIFLLLHASCGTKQAADEESAEQVMTTWILCLLAQHHHQYHLQTTKGNDHNKNES